MTTLNTLAVAWTGTADDETRAQLRRRGVRVAGPADAGVVALVVASRAPPRPRSVRLPWVWWSAGAPEPVAAARAVLDGACAVIDATQPGACARLVARIEALGTPTTPPHTDRFLAHGPAAQRALLELWRAAQTSMPVLITGETGTGKEVSAHLVHAWSARRHKPFIAINCAAIPDELMEAELFGYQRGAFSGAVHAYGGRLLAGAGGTVFLDELDDTPLSLQMKLLRVLEDRVVSRLGEDDEHTVDFRIVAATNRDLRALIARGAFGEDLYERLAIVTVHLPPLRERIEDIAPLVRHFIARFYVEEPAARSRHDVRDVEPACLALLERHRWPGNIRELRNVVYAALVHKADGDALTVADLPRALLQDAAATHRAVTDDALAQWVRAQVATGRFDLSGAVRALERASVVEALGLCDGNATAAARLLGRVGRGSARDPGGTLRAMMKRLGVASKSPAVSRSR